MIKQKRANMPLPLIAGIIISMTVAGILIAFQTGTIDTSGNELLSPVLNAAGLGGPRIVDFRANPAPDNTHGTLEYTLQNIGRVKNVKITQKHKTYPAETEKETAPIFYELKDKGVLKQYRGDKDIGYTVKPGYNTFTLIVEPNKQEQSIGGKIVKVEPSRKTITINAYDEPYLERHEATIEGCPNTQFSDKAEGKINYFNLQGCNVIECKKSDFLLIRAPEMPTCYEPFVNALRKTADEFGNEEKTDKCGELKEGEEDDKLGYAGGAKAASIEFSGCSPEQVDKFNKMSSRAWMAYYSCEGLLGAHKGALKEEDYTKLNYDELLQKREDATKRTTACVEGYYKKSDGSRIDGLRNRLNAIGFQPTGKFERAKKIAEYLRKHLPPKLKGLLVFPDKDKLELAWTLSDIGDNDRIEAFEVYQTYKQYPRKTDSKNKEYTDLRATLTKEEAEKEKWEMDNSRMGLHTFTVKVKDATGTILDTVAKEAGIYDRKYVETYTGGAENCASTGIGACDIIKDKEEFATKNRDKDGSYKTLIEIAKDVKNAGSKCEVKSSIISGVKLSDCSPEEIDAIYKEYLKRKGFDTETEQPYYDCKKTDAYVNRYVCNEKNVIIKTLKQEQWTCVNDCEELLPTGGGDGGGD